ncbi:glycoside hydrolase family 15 protein [Sulfuracidifex metallicus]|uniref:glycoside hydrolase family 15 protein n=1 Tax=Sulfuracidifex metallicus TaxID=47303 RepID=UPI0022730B3A|nr:glycoside hydrolase family 15 protein [Sulfuracidifex metallicus]MCY0850244.1 glycoside hydrolase family 15 protein [Sulfuracidifex metallicus]
MKPLPCINNEFTGAIIRDTDVVWLSFPRYDSPSVFSSLLDEEKGGHFRIESKVVSQEYVVPNVVSTKLKDGSEIIDLLLYGDHGIVRKIRANSELKVDLSPSFYYGRNGAKVKKVTDKVFRFFDNGTDFLEAHFLFDEVKYDGSWYVKGEGYIYLGYFSDERFGIYGKNVSFNIERGFDRTMNYWKNLMKRERGKGKVAELKIGNLTGDKLLDAYQNSVGMLLGLMYNPTGAVVGSPTTSLPEVEGGTRNWDSRYAWVRDSSAVAEALIATGYAQEARRIIEFLSRMVSFVSKPFMYSLYSIDGSLPPKEIEIPWLSGYKGSSPVRIGNDALALIQLDLEGSFMNAFYKYYEATGDDNYVKNHADILEYVADWISDNWKEDDVGIWEERDTKAQNVHSKVMAWVALDRAGKLMKAIDRDNPWREARNEIKEWIMDNGVVEGKFVKRIGGNEVDASLLTLPLYGFIDVKDEIFQATLRQIEETLSVDGLLKRYKQDSLGECIYPSTLSSLWLARIYIKLGRLDDAKLILEKILEVGDGFYLVGDKINVKSKEFLGNYPNSYAQANLVMALEEIAERESAEDKGKKGENNNNKTS